MKNTSEMEQKKLRRGKKLVITTVLAICLTLLSCLSGGCILIMQADMALAHNRDVTRNSGDWDEYALGQKYILSMDVFLKRVNDWSERLVLTPPGELYQCAGLYSSPESIADYYENPNAWLNVEDVIESGTHIQCKMIRKHGTLMWGSSVTLFAEILDGPYQGEVVDIEDLSVLSKKEYRGCILRNPDCRILQKVFEESTQTAED